MAPTQHPTVLIDGLAAEGRVDELEALRLSSRSMVMTTVEEDLAACRGHFSVLR
jgi:hypothetical protein